jgi:ferredoxin-NADP reductase
MKYIDNILNRVTMYRLLLYGLAVLVFIAIGGAFADKVSFSPYGLLASVAILLITCYLTNKIFAYFYGACTTFESSTITALILFFIFSPPTNAAEAGILVLAGTIAMASKYILAYRERLLFNPAAIAAVIVSLTGLGSATWWVASQYMAGFVLVLGILIIRKVRRAKMFFMFLVTAVAVILLKHISGGFDLSLFKGVALSWPFVFLGTIMLTEPMTMPARKRQQLIYAVIVGYVFTSGLHTGRIFSTPEVALVVGNIFAFFTLTRQRLRLRLVKAGQYEDGVREFLFKSDTRFSFKPGQYVDITLLHAKTDKRGSRRTFTFASAPHEEYVRFAMKCPQPMSSFKSALLSLEQGTYMYGSQIAGDFTLPNDTHKKLLFIAGGIGVTPFRSIVMSLLELNQSRDMILLYVSSEPHGFTYGEVFQEAARVGLKVIYILSASEIPTDWKWEKGHIDQALLMRLIPDVGSRYCYISGPNAMVSKTKKILIKSGVRRRHIKTDYFSGY